MEAEEKREQLLGIPHTGAGLHAQILNLLASPGTPSLTHKPKDPEGLASKLIRTLVG